METPSDHSKKNANLERTKKATLHPLNADIKNQSLLGQEFLTFALLRDIMPLPI